MFYLFRVLVRGDGAKDAGKRCGVNLRSVGEHGAPEAATFIAQLSEEARGECAPRKWAVMTFYIFNKSGEKKGSEA